MSGNVQKRPVVMAKAAGSGPVPPAPAIASLQMGGAGRVPEGGQGINNMAKIKSIFDGSGGNPNVSKVKMAGSSSVNKRAIVFARPSLGQEEEAAPAAPPMPPAPPTNVGEVLVREGGSQGLTRREASDIAAVLEGSIENTVLALSEGQTCIGIDDSSIQSARDILAGMKRFGVVGNSSERLDLRPTEIDLIEQVLECGSTYQKLKEAGRSRTMAFVAGGLIIGAVVLLVTS